MNTGRRLAAVGVLVSLAGAGGCMDQAVARAGRDRTVAAGATVTLDGSASTPDRSGALAYAWEVADGPAVVFADPAARTTTFAAPALATETTFRIRLTVTYIDLLGSPVPSNSDTDEVIIRVRSDQNAAEPDPAAGENANASGDGTGQPA